MFVFSSIVTVLMDLFCFRWSYVAFWLAILKLLVELWTFLTTFASKIYTQINFNSTFPSHNPLSFIKSLTVHCEYCAIQKSGCDWAPHVIFMVRSSHSRSYIHSLPNHYVLYLCVCLPRLYYAVILHCTHLILY